MNYSSWVLFDSADNPDQGTILLPELHMVASYETIQFEVHQRTQVFLCYSQCDTN